MYIFREKKREFIVVTNKVELFNDRQFILFQDVVRVYYQRKDQVYVILVEFNQILFFFDESLRKYVESKIKQRERFQFVKLFVIRNFL